MRIKHKVKVSIAEDNDMKNKLFDRDETLSEVDITGYIHQSSGTIKVAAGATESVPFGDVENVKGCFIRMDKDVKLKLNGSADELQLRKSGTTTGVTAKFFAEMDFTQIEIVGHATEDANGVYCVWGDTA